MSKDTYYLTTPIYYPSDKLHIGHAYTTVAADSITRFKRLTGYDVFFLTGTDEHGQKIERIAKAKGIEPKEYVDKIVETIKELWKTLDIKNDGFVRTTDDYHVRAVQKMFRQLYEQGDIYKTTYSGHYCTPCESFWTERQLVNGMCPDCGRPVEVMEEESYFFKTSKYADRLIEHIKTHPEFIQPPTRTNEMLQNFLLPGLEDLCVSRTSLKWGIPVDFDSKHTVYVWLDALSNYITALGYGSDDDSLFKKYWPANVHLVGKEIVRFHSITWPIMLMALGIELPKQIFGHGWLVLDGGKMSKSKGNVVDPVILVDRYGVDAIRYFLMREMPFGSDGVFNNEALLNRINSDLANDLGNLLSRTVAMIEKYFDGFVPAQGELNDTDRELISLFDQLPEKVESAMDAFKFSDALVEIWKAIGASNKYIDVTMPWSLAKNPDDKARLGTVLYNLAEALRNIAIMISPVMTRSAPEIFKQLGIFNNPALQTWESTQSFGALPSGTKVEKGEALFPRIDVAKELENLVAAQHAGQPVKEEAKQETKPESAPAPAANSHELPAPPAEITIEDFTKLDLRTAKVINAEYIEKADKLLKLTVSVGGEERTICSGIRQWYKPEDIIGKTVVIVANLKPRKMRGLMSHGMILCACDDEAGKLSFVTTAQDIGDGLQVT